MIIEYNRPETIEDAIALIIRDDPPTYPLGGGTVLNLPSSEAYAVVDLQSLGLKGIDKGEDFFSMGATTTLQDILDDKEIPEAVKLAIKHEVNYNFRQVATIAGSIVAGGGRSPINTIFLAADAKIEFFLGEKLISLGDFLSLRKRYPKKNLILKVKVPTKTKLAYSYVARTPADFPIVCVGVGQWTSGRTRVILGGFGDSPILAFDGPEDSSAGMVARDAYYEAGDEWASASYRSDVAEILVNRCLTQLRMQD